MVGMVFADINLLMVLIVTVITFLIGWLWYSPLLFGNAWVKAMNLSKSDIKKAKEKGMGKTILVGFIAELVMIYVLAFFVAGLGAATFMAGLKIGFMIWLGFIATIMIGGMLWEGKSFELYAINVLHRLVTIIIAGGLLAIWV
jgi:hypothetical protein